MDTINTATKATVCFPNQKDISDVVKVLTGTWDPDTPYITSINFADSIKCLNDNRQSFATKARFDTYVPDDENNNGYIFNVEGTEDGVYLECNYTTDDEIIHEYDCSFMMDLEAAEQLSQMLTEAISIIKRIKMHNNQIKEVFSAIDKFIRNNNTTHINVQFRNLIIEDGNPLYGHCTVSVDVYEFVYDKPMVHIEFISSNNLLEVHKASLIQYINLVKESYGNKLVLKLLDLDTVYQVVDRLMEKVPTNSAMDFTRHEYPEHIKEQAKDLLDFLASKGYISDKK